MAIVSGNSERIGMNCEEKIIDGTIEPLAVYSARMVTITAESSNDVESNVKCV